MVKGRGWKTGAGGWRVRARSVGGVPRSIDLHDCTATRRCGTVRRMDPTDTRVGGCLCGAVRFTATGPFREVVFCHCTQCRRTSGHYWASTSVPLDRLTFRADRGLRWFRSSDSAERGFCGDCGASLFWKPEGEPRMAIAAGAFDGATGFAHGPHIFTEDAGDYYAPDGPPPPFSGIAPGQLSCQCLCGAVAFTVAGPAGHVTA